MNKIVYSTCPNCGHILTEGTVALPNGDQTRKWACDNCKRVYYENTEKVVFKQLKLGGRISGRWPKEGYKTDKKPPKNDAEKV